MLGSQAGVGRGRWGAGGRRQAAGAGSTSVRALGAHGAGGSGRAAGCGRARQGAGRGTCARGLGQLGAPAPGLVSNLVFRLGIFPESPNEHCSL